MICRRIDEHTRAMQALWWLTSFACCASSVPPLSMLFMEQSLLPFVELLLNCGRRLGLLLRCCVCFSTSIIEWVATVELGLRLINGICVISKVRSACAWYLVTDLHLNWKFLGLNRSFTKSESLL